MAPALSVGPKIELIALRGLPIVEAGCDVAGALCAALDAMAIALEPCDVLVIASTLVSRAEGRYVDLGAVEPGDAARRLAVEFDNDPRLVEVILRDTAHISRAHRGALIVRHRLGFVSANAAVDASNAVPASAGAGSGPWVLRMAEDPDGSARRLRAAVEAHTGARPVGVVLSDSLGRPFRLGSVGAAVGVSGVPALVDHRGKQDLFGRPLEATMTGLADQLAAAADLLAGQADEGTPATLIRGLRFDETDSAASDLLRPQDQDLYA